MVTFVGKYNLDFPGRVGNNNEYEMLIVSEFDNNDNEIARKTFYLNNTVETAKRLLDSEILIVELMERPNYSRIRLAQKTMILNAR